MRLLGRCWSARNTNSNNPDNQEPPPSRTNRLALKLFGLVVILAAIFGIVYGVITSRRRHPAPTATIGNATVVGVYMDKDMDFFGGIPFAEPPVGSLRFAPPVLRTSVNVSRLVAQGFGLGCIQQGSTASSGVAEDCLTLNIVRPHSLNKGELVPVMVWIYGGGFSYGASSSYDPRFLVYQSIQRGTPVIYVSMNYRLGPLGFPQGQEASEHGILNLGLKDQVAALQWVQSNIGAFGGDKDKVTVFGESAGAASVSTLALSSAFNSLARAVILQSGSAATTLTYNATTRNTNWEVFAGLVPSCSYLATSGNTLSCLQSASIAEIVNAFTSSASYYDELFPWVPVVDGEGGVFPDYPSNVFAAGSGSSVAVMAGTCLDDSTLFTPTTVSSEQDIYNWIVANYTPTVASVQSQALSSAAAQVLQLYPDDPSQGIPANTGNQTFGLSSQYKRMAAIYNDLLFLALRRMVLQAAGNAGQIAYGYIFSDPQPSSPGYLGIKHGSDLTYIYGNGNGATSSQALSVQLKDYFISFATSLNPNDGRGSERPQWTQFTNSNQNIIQLWTGNTTMIPDDERSQQINYLNSNARVFHH